MIQIRGLEFAYPEGDFRLRIPDFAVGAGEKVAVIGPSGSGKTTLLNLVGGILVPQQGQVQVAGVPVHQYADAQRRDFRIATVGFVFQDFELLDYLTTWDNILHPYRITRALTLDGAVRERAHGLAARMGIAGELERRPGRLSQGEKQRAAICRALLPEPKLILADEATGNLDPVNKSHILDLLFAAVDAKGSTLLAVTHDRELLSRFDRVVDFHGFRNGAGGPT